MLRVEQFHVGGFDDNMAYLLIDEPGHDTFIVDPSGDVTALLTYITVQKLVVRGIVLTHTHQDHYDALNTVMAQHSVPVYVHSAGQAAVATSEPVALHDDDQISLGDSACTVLHTPGHSTDSICLFVVAEESCDQVPFLISGDTLFVRGCGRTDETGVEALYESLTRLCQLPPATTVYPGHDYGPTSTSTIEEELQQNRFLQATTSAAFAQLRLA